MITYQFDRAIIKIVTNGLDDVFSGTSGSGITVNMRNNPLGGADSITFSGTATIANYLSVLETLQYSSNAGQPTTSGIFRTINIRVRNVHAGIDEDGLWSEIQRGFGIIGINRAPVLTDTRDDQTNGAVGYKFTEASDSVVIGDSLTIVDDDNGFLDSAVIRISNNYFKGDSLIFKNATTNGATITSSLKAFAPGKGDSITISGTDTITNYVTALNLLTFKSISENPTNFGNNLTRTITITVRDVPDGTESGLDAQFGSLTRTFTVVNVNTSGRIVDDRNDKDSSALRFTEGGDSIVIGDSFTITDVDNQNLDSAVIRITNKYLAGDSLLFAGAITNGATIVNNLKVFTPGLGDSITISGTDTLANYEAALDNLVFKHFGTNPTNNATQISRTIKFTLREETSKNEFNTTRKISILAVNKAPVIAEGRSAGNRGNFVYTQNDSVVIDSITISDFDGTELDSAVITISGNYLTGDSLIFKGVDLGTRRLGTTGIYAYVPQRGDVITLSGQGGGAINHDAFEKALDSLVFRHNTDNPTDNGSKTTRTITIQVRDKTLEGVAGQWSTAFTRTIDVNGFNTKSTITDTRNPNNPKTAITFTENGNSVVIGDSFTITDNDSRKLDSIVIRITGDYVEGDSLIFKNITANRNYANAAGIFAYIPGKGDSITLSGKATLANYISTLDSLVYLSSSTTPTGTAGPGFPKDERTITIKIRNVHPNEDSIGLITTITRTISIVAINRQPTLTDNRNDQTVTATAYTFIENGDEIKLGDSLTLTDPENFTFDSVVIRISNKFTTGDSLFFTGVGTFNDAYYTFGATGDSITLGANKSGNNSSNAPIGAMNATATQNILDKLKI